MAENYVIIGAGEAGVAAAGAIRGGAKDARIRLVTDEEGLPYERPPLSKDVLLRETAPTLLRPASWYEENSIELVRARAEAILPAEHVVRIASDVASSEQLLPYERLLIATGASARRLPYTGVLYLRTWRDAMAIRARLGRPGKVVVIGGGVIGLELASTAKALGHEVVVLELGTRLMARALAPDLSSWLQARHVECGVDIRLGAQIANIDVIDQGHVVTLEDGSSLTANLIIAGIGAAPETELARSAGCAVQDGIVVDAQGRTSVEDIFAAGDGARFFHPVIDGHIRLEAWQHAGRHGAHVGEVMTGEAQDYSCTPWFWTDQQGVNLQVAGFAAESDKTVWRGDGPKKSAFHFLANRLVAASTIDNGRDMRPAIQLIEAGWTGDPAIFSDEAVPLRTIAQTWRTAPSSLQTTAL
nr:FAD-dependent oxidoreductase [Sphingomonas sp. CDS-1]